jgi:tetratricopeptide (TPR) repeat protein
MKRILLLAVLASALSANAQIKMPAPSTTQTITQDFGMGKIELVYSRPNIKGRTLFKDNSELAPLGKVWRTGANAVTKIKLLDAITMGGKNIDTGSYAIWTIPGKKEWTIIINKDSKNWGTQYVEADDLLRFTVAAETMKESIETLTMQFADIKPESCELHIMWGNTAVRIPITTNIRDRIRKQVETALSADKVNPNTYFTAANFYFDLDKDLNKALANATKAAEANTNAYWVFILKAKIERDLGDKASAKADAEKCIKLATDQKNDDYVRMANDLIKKL